MGIIGQWLRDGVVYLTHDSEDSSFIYRWLLQPITKFNKELEDYRYESDQKGKVDDMWYGE